MNYKLILSLVFVMFCFSALSGASEDVGTSGFAFLKITYSAQTAAKANAYTGQADNIETVFFNSAGLPNLKNKTVYTSYISYFEGFQGGAVAFAMPYNETVSFAIHAQYLGNNSIEKTEIDEQGNFIPTSGLFGANNIVFGISGGKYIHEMLNIGLGLKVIRDNLDEHSATAIVGDVALLHQTTNEHLKVGITLKNFGKQFTYYTPSKYEEKLPTLAVVGFSYSPRDEFIANMDIEKPFNDSFKARAGVEYKVHSLLALRAGYNANASDWKVGGDYDYLSGISAGFGCNWKNYTLDYAVSSYGDLGLINQVSFKLDF